MTHRERSILSMPASDWRKIEKGVGSGADVALLDLEDSLAPGEKVASRQTVIRAFRELDWGGKPRAYRVNGLDTQYFYRDVIDVVEAAGDRVDLIIVPKVGRPEDLSMADTLLTQIELNRGLQPGRITLEAQIETAGGLVNVERIATASSRLAALIFGPGDFAASVRMPARSIGGADEWDESYPGHRFHYAMARIVTAARAAGIRAIDGPVADFRDVDGLRRSCRIARGLGFDGKWCIHPSQIPVVNEAFSPAAEEVARAQRVVDAYRAAVAEGSGVISVDGVMVDEASVKMAKSILALEDGAGRG